MATASAATLTLAEAAEALRKYAAERLGLPEEGITEVYVQSYNKTRVYIEYLPGSDRAKFHTFPCPGHWTS